MNFLSFRHWMSNLMMLGQRWRCKILMMFPEEEHEGEQRLVLLYDLQKNETWASWEMKENKRHASRSNLKRFKFLHVSKCYTDTCRVFNCLWPRQWRPWRNQNWIFGMHRTNVTVVGRPENMHTWAAKCWATAGTSSSWYSKEWAKINHARQLMIQKREYQCKNSNG